MTLACAGVATLLDITVGMKVSWIPVVRMETDYRCLAGSEGEPA